MRHSLIDRHGKVGGTSLYCRGMAERAWAAEIAGIKQSRERLDILPPKSQAKERCIAAPLLIGREAKISIVAPHRAGDGNKAPPRHWSFL